MVFHIFMAIFKHPRERKSNRDSRDSSSKRDSSSNRDRSGKGSFEDFHKGKRDSGRRSNNYSRNRRDGPSRDRREVEMTKVICSSCGKECEVPFKPTSSKPVYCAECFAKINKAGSDKVSNRDFDIINEKLDKIMKALKIE